MNRRFLFLRTVSCVALAFSFAVFVNARADAQTTASSVAMRGLGQNSLLAAPRSSLAMSRQHGVKPSGPRRCRPRDRLLSQFADGHVKAVIYDRLVQDGSLWAVKE